VLVALLLSCAPASDAAKTGRAKLLNTPRNPRTGSFPARMPRLTLGEGMTFRASKVPRQALAKLHAKVAQAGGVAAHQEKMRKQAACRRAGNPLLSCGKSQRKPPTPPPAPVPFSAEHPWIPTYLDTTACGDLREPDLSSPPPMPPPSAPAPSPPPGQPSTAEDVIPPSENSENLVTFSDKSREGAVVGSEDGSRDRTHGVSVPADASLAKFCPRVFSIQDEVISKIIRHEQHNLWHVLQGKAIDTYLRKHRMHREVLLAQMEEERIRAMPVNSNGEDIHSNAGTLAREVAEQRRALLSIQQSAASESALWGWPLMEHYCSWDGVHCDGRAHVIRLDFSDKGITGVIPSHFSRFQSLQTLELASNGLTGSLPRQLSVLWSLNSLNLAHNNLTGSLPAPWSSLTALQQLDVRSNRLSGALPRAWASLPLLQDLDLSGNALTGPLPAAWSSLASLEHISLADNRLTGGVPAAWANLTQMRSVQLQHNRLQSPLPLALQNMTQLKKVALQGNRFRGTLPNEWAGLVNLEYLNVGDNRLSGSLPQNWLRMPALRHLLLSNNDFRGRLPVQFRLLRMLHRLEAANNHLVGEVPPGWSALAYLNYLDLEGNTGLRGRFSGSNMYRSINRMYGPNFVARELSHIPFD